jgi:tRNA dimethylallyltransferase
MKDSNDSLRPGVPPPAELPSPEVIDVEAVYKGWKNGDIDLVCVLGPTASGKTRYAVNLARQLNALAGGDTLGPSGLGMTEGASGTGITAAGLNMAAEIISADSRQVYRGMDIGTGKDLAEYGEIPYHLIDIVDAGEPYDLYNYQQDFERVYADIRERGCLPILCGGTGLYIQAVTSAYNLPVVPPDPDLRAELEEADIEELREAYCERCEPDPAVMESKRRLIRALEIEFYKESHPLEKTDFRPKKTFFIGTVISREERNARIDRRLDERLAEGMIEEVQGLLDNGVPAETLLRYGLEYKFVTEYLLGLVNREEMRNLLATAIHQFAKRQMTFFRGMEAKGTVIHWTSPLSQ